MCSAQEEGVLVHVLKRSLARNPLQVGVSEFCQLAHSMTFHGVVKGTEIHTSAVTVTYMQTPSSLCLVIGPHDCYTGYGVQFILSI